jgi:hypothetical protein
MSKLQLFCISSLLLFFFSCVNNNQESTAGKPENDVDAARMFIRNALDGKYTDARKLMLQDSLNLELLDAFQHNYETRMSREDKRGYRESSINMHNVRQLNDSTTVVNYSNSYKNQQDSLKLVRKNGDWLVDFKYSFPGAGSTKK